MADNFVHIPTYKGINPSDYTITPFQVFKEWSFNNTDYSSSGGIHIYKSNYPTATNYKNELIPISSSRYTATFTQDSKDTKVLWSSINHLYYKDYNKHQFPYSETELNLYGSASIISLPQAKYGETIKVGSIECEDYSIQSQSLSSSLEDDGKSNLIDVAISSESFAPKNNLVAYWGFNDKYKYVDTFEIKGDTKVKDFSNNEHIGIISGSSTKFTEGITTTGLFSSASGHQLTLHGESTMEVKNSDYINFKSDEDFAISLWVNIPETQPVSSSTQNYILSKQRHGIEEVYDKNLRRTKRIERDLNRPYYPYSLIFNNHTHSNPGTLTFKRTNGLEVLELTTTSSIADSLHHIVVQKTGSNVELYVDGTAEVSGSDIGDELHNDCKLFLGGLGRNLQRMSGSLDEVRIYNSALTQTQIDSLGDNDFITGSAYQTKRVGNVFYEDGFIVISDPRPKYRNAFLGKNGQNDYTSGSINYGFKLDYKSTVTYYQHEIVCKIRQSEYNMTFNPSVRVGGTMDSQEPKTFVSSSNWTPYITQIGLYNDKAQLVAIGKLARPLPKRNDVDMNIIVRFDA